VVLILTARTDLPIWIEPERRRRWVLHTVRLLCTGTNSFAAQKFHELTLAYELLLDPIRRTALDDKLKVKAARKQRYAAYDAKRKTMMDELDNREREFKKTKVAEAQEKSARANEEERIKEDGRRMMREKAAEKLKTFAPPSPKERPDVKGKAKEVVAPSGKFRFRAQPFDNVFGFS